MTPPASSRAAALRSTLRSFSVRLFLFASGLFLSAFAVALMARSGLGTAPVSTLPYALSRLLPLSFGSATALTNAGFLLAQIVVLGKQFKPQLLLQLAVAASFGAFVDAAMTLTAFAEKISYWGAIAVCIASCVILGFGIALQIRSDVSFLPAEGLVRAVSLRHNLKFGRVKIVCDSSYVLTAAILTLLFLSKVEGVREGTLISALSVGFFVSLSFKLLDRAGALSRRTKWENKETSLTCSDKF